MRLHLHNINMLTMKYLYTLLLLTFALSGINAQSLDEELGFIYVKADYLLETNRYEDAIKEFTKIVAKNDTYKDVLYKRAYAKYMIAAYKGTKKDLLQSFDVVGITPEGVTLYAKVLENLGQDEAASKTSETASMLNGKPTGSRSNGGSTGSGSGDNGNNDESDEGQMKKIEDAIGSILDDLLPDRKNSEGETDGGGRTDQSGDSTDTPTDEDSSQTSRRGDSKSPVLKLPEEDKPDNSVKEIFIDEDLTLEIKNGLGARKILDQPSILILSESSGTVSVDICVNRNGKVTTADFNKSDSTISTQSLVSVAQRKAKEFWFAESSQAEMCGTILFKISGSN